MKKSNLVLCGLLVIALLCLNGPASGERISEKIQLNGFLSQGFMYSSKNDFIPQSSKNGSFEFSEFGLTFSTDVNEKLRLGFQFLARDLGPIGNHQLKLDWGFADYRFSNLFGVKVGKIKTPLGFYNEIRDTDALFPMVVLPQSIYDETMRPVFVAYNGIGFYGDLDIGLGRLNYHLFTGGVNHPEDAPYLVQIKNAVNRGLTGTGMSFSPPEMDTQVFMGGRLIWQTPLRGLRLGGSYVYFKSEYDGKLSVPMVGDTTIFGTMKIAKFFFLSGEWAIGDFTLTSEYMELPVDLRLDMMGQEISMTDEIMQGWYVMGSYVFGDKLTVYAYYDRFLSDKGDDEGLSAIKAGLPAFFGWQKDTVMGLRYDVSFNWTVKAEFHIIDGVAKSAVFFPTYVDAKQKWNMFAVKISFNF